MLYKYVYDRGFVVWKMIHLQRNKKKRLTFGPVLEMY